MTQAHDFDDDCANIFCHYKLQSKYTYIESIKITLRVCTYAHICTCMFVNVCELLPSKPAHSSRLLGN